MVQQKYLIEGYYSAYRFHGIFSTGTLAQSYIDDQKAKALDVAWVSYLDSMARRELLKLHESEIFRLSDISNEIRRRQPKYFGDTRDKEALARHHELKQGWNNELCTANDAYHNYVNNNVYVPATATAVTRSATPIPDDLIEVVQGWGDIPEFDVSEVVIDMEI
jgi:hypothetical protein